MRCLFALLLFLALLPRPAHAQATPTPVTATVNFSLVNLYNTPSQSMSVVGQVRQGQRCTVDGRDPTGAWLLVNCDSPSGPPEGWLDRRLVNVTGSLAAVEVTDRQVSASPPTGPLQPTPAPPAVTPPASFAGWKASYYNNPTLSGFPAAYADLPSVDLDWAFASPAPAIPVDYFSATFERTYTFPQGWYRFNAFADDGVRLFVDQELVISQWRQASGVQYTATRWLSGPHSLRLEYLELVGAANVRFNLEFSPTAPPWQATYYQGAPNRGPQVLAQAEFGGSMQIQRTWGMDSPLPTTLPADGWNGRWVGRFDFGGGNYLFRARADDGVRVYLNDTLVINGWTDGPHDLTNSFRNVGQGTHTITVDYYDRSGYAYLQVFWYTDQLGPNYVP